MGRVWKMVLPDGASEKVSVNGIDIFLLEAQDAAWLASYEWNIRARFITS